MDKGQISRILDEMAVLLEIKDANPFRVRAYENGARILEGLGEDLETLVKTKKLTKIKGIGEGLAEIIADLVLKGKSKEYNQLKKSVPKGLLEMIAIQGLGPKKVKALYRKLKIKSIVELERACKQDRLKKLNGFGEKTQENILKGIKLRKKSQGKFMFSTAYEQAQRLKAYLLQALTRSKKIENIEIAGSLRRRKEFIKDIDILVSSPDPEAVMKQFIAYPEADRQLSHGETKSSITLSSGINADLRVVRPKQFPYALHYFTGSKAHNTELRAIAKAKGMKLNEYGLFTGSPVKGKKNIPCKNEAAIFKTLGLGYIEPELRENLGEFEAARKNALPKRLVEVRDIRGVFHNHTTESDGNATLAEMVEKAQEMGLEYIGISDHSQSAHYAHGLNTARLKKQWKAIDALNKKLKKIRILKGSEVDILPDGALDFPDNILAQFDFVIASVHSKFKMTEKEMTQRVIKALKNKYVTMIGHPTGRLLLTRDPYPIHLYDLTRAASDYGKAMELNANPHRFDIDWRICKFAKSKKVPVSINPDAHSARGIEDVEFGVGIARKGWLTKKDVLNTKSLTEMTAFLKSYR